MRTDLSVRTPAGRTVDLRIHARAGTRLADVDQQLRSACGVTTDAPLWTAQAPAPPAIAFGEPGLRDGCELVVGAPTGRRPAVTNQLHLGVVGGPDSGCAIALRAGVIRVGRGHDCDLRLADPDVSRHHLHLTASSAGGVRATDSGSRNGTQLEGAPLTTGAPVAPGQVLRIGDSLIAVGGVHDPPALLRPAADGSVRVVARSTPPPAPRPVEITMPSEDPTPMSPRIPWIAAALPLLTGVGFALLMHSLQFLLFTLLTPLAMVGTALGERISGLRGRRRRRREQRHRAAEICSAVERHLAAETALRRRRDPDPTALAAIARLPTARLWERSLCDADLMRVRLGSADLEASTTVRRGHMVAPAASLWSVPLVVDLADGPLGITGPLPVARAVARWVIAQLVTLGPPGRVTLAAFLSDDAPHWRWLRWLPHLTFEVGVTGGARQDLLRQVDQLIGAREADRETARAARVVVVVDADGDESSALIPLLARGARVGVSAVWVGRPATGIPPICTQAATVSGETGSRLTLIRADSEDAGNDARGSATTAIADQVSAEWAEGVARALAPLRDTPDGADTAAPSSLVHAPGMELEGIEARWDDADLRPRTMLGTNEAGSVWLDLAEDGPHALVAGTTGSGKSELLRTVVAGLALRQSPDTLSFLLIDYKGGAAFAECARLPHVAGVVTDLDPQLTSRALRCLEAELRRRERLFATVSAADLDAYRAHGGTAAPRLVIVVDEFAALAAELPEFVQGLVSVAQRGRSLGVHLVLATQRPGTCVSPDIRANTALRIVLRVADPAESFDLIGRPDAARIAKTCPGRAVVSCGDRVDEVQVSHLGRRSDRVADRPSVELLDEWRQRVDGGEPHQPTGPTDLQSIVQAVTAAARGRGTACVQPPWLPPLANSIPLGSLPVDPQPTRVAFGLADRADLQDQPPEVIDVADGDAVLIAGAARSGRSTALRAIATAAVRRLPPQRLHVYVIDCAGGALGELAEFPHCVTATTLADWDVLAELIRRLEMAVLPRRQYAASGGQDAGAPGETSPQPADGPAMQLVLIDGWEELVAASADRDLGRTADAAARLIAAAGSAGTTIVLTGGRAALASRPAAGIAAKYLLRLADRADYSLAGISPREVPAHMPAGRALRAPDGVEVQIAAPDQAVIMAEPGRRRGEGFSLRPLPTALRVADLPASPGLLRIGLTGTAGTLTGLPADGLGGVLVCGPPASGRSTVLRLLLREASRLGLATVLCARPGSALQRDAAVLGVPVLDPRDAHATDVIRGSRLLLLDDADALVGTAVDDAACALLSALPGNHLVVATAGIRSLAPTFRGLLPTLLRNRRALLLRPEPSDGDLLGLRLPAASAYGHVPGRGVLIGNFATSAPCPPTVDGCSWVQVAQPVDTDVGTGTDTDTDTGTGTDAGTGTGCGLSPCADTGDPPAARTSP